MGCGYYGNCGVGGIHRFEETLCSLNYSITMTLSLTRDDADSTDGV